jgi:hypothetical protein
MEQSIHQNREDGCQNQSNNEIARSDERNCKDQDLAQNRVGQVLLLTLREFNGNVATTNVQENHHESSEQLAFVNAV